MGGEFCRWAAALVQENETPEKNRRVFVGCDR